MTIEMEEQNSPLKSEQEIIEISRSCWDLDNYIRLPKKMIALLGYHTTALLSYLIYKEIYFENRGELTEDRFFYNLMTDIEANIFLTKKMQMNALDTLEELKLIKTKLLGMPAKKYYKINHLTLSSQFSQKVISSSDKRAHQEVTKGHITNNTLTNNPSICASHSSLLRKKLIIKKSLSKKEIMKKGIKETLAEQKGKRDEKEKEKLKRFVSFDMKKIIDYWINKNLPFHREGTKTYAIAMDRLKALLKGTLFNGMDDKSLHNRIFSFEEIKRSIDNFVLAAYNLDYEPVDKKFLSSVDFVNFFYTTVSWSTKSFFLKYLVEKPSLRKDSKIFAVKDINPEATKILMAWYKKTFSGRDSSFSLKNRNDLVYAVNELKRFYEENKSHLTFDGFKISYNQTDPICFLAIQLTRAFEKELRDNDSFYLIMTTGWFKSEKTIKERLPKFLRLERMMK